jgi:hypothetical protein
VKDEVFDAFVAYKNAAENQTNTKLKRFRDDKGGEYIGQKWDTFFALHGITHEHTTKGTPQQNGIAEQTNHTITECITAMLQQAKLLTSMWGDAMRLLVHIMNATPTSAVPNMTPHEAWHGNKPDLSMLCTFGCRAYVHIQKQDRAGLESHSRKCIYIGFEDGYKGWQCLDPSTKRTVISRDVIFNETDFPGLHFTAEMNPPLPIISTWTPPSSMAPPGAQQESANTPDTQADMQLNPMPDPESDHAPQSPPPLTNEAPTHTG